MCVTPWANVVVVHRKRSPVKRLIELARVGHRLPVGSVNLLRSVREEIKLVCGSGPRHQSTVSGWTASPLGYAHRMTPVHGIISRAGYKTSGSNAGRR